jgi:hypothetical protein
VVLTPKQVDRLSRSYGAIRAGDYWYDRRSGLWGRAGRPTEGQIAAGLSLGGRLKPAASGGTTGVFVNGRELDAQELSRIERHRRFLPGRYWLDPDGTGGMEGGAATIDAATSRLLLLPRLPESEFQCPWTPSIDCMPSTFPYSHRLECTDDYLDWARAHCPGLEVTW